MMAQQLTKSSAGSVLFLTPEILQELGLQGDEKVELRLSSGSLVMTPIPAESVEPRDLQSCLDEVVETRREVLRRLAQ